jgi:hypothetical protein
MEKRKSEFNGYGRVPAVDGGGCGIRSSASGRRTSALIRGLLLEWRRRRRAQIQQFDLKVQRWPLRPTYRKTSNLPCYCGSALIFGCDPATLPVVEQQFAPYERANLHLAIAEMLADPRRRSELLGVIVLEEYRGASLARLSRPASAKSYDQGPVEYADVPLPGERHLGCVKNGLYLIREDDRPLAVLLTESPRPWQPQIGVEVMAPERDDAEKFSRQLSRLTRHGKAFRGHVLSLQQDCHGGLQVHFHRLPPIGRDELILPDSLLRRVERHTLSFNRNAERLRAAQRHLKRGLLLHGPPGTGKTLTAMYLVTQMPGRTVLLLTGAGMGSIETACKLARMLVPATVILEDVDLIGTQRHLQTVDANALLFELLNEMDGLADDTDIIFVLTTNRPDILEPALAARPGQIDQSD